jgi:hypothetical protein
MAFDVKFRPIKETLKTICLIILIAFTCHGGQTYASPIKEAQYITDKMIVEIARKTLDGNRLFGQVGRDPLEKRSVEVRTWLESMGGDNWYKNYLVRFGAPTGVNELKTATLIGLFERQLGYYYVRNFPVSTESMTVLWCNGPNSEKNPTMKAQCALANRNAAMAFNDAQALAKFRSLAEWFLLNHVDGRWEWSIDLPSRDLKAPWISGLTQSQGISVLLREYQLGNDPRYLAVARQALDWLKKPMEGGGLSKKMQKGVFYEEYPSTAKPSHVLNGHMWALFGIWDFYRVTHDKVAKLMFDEGVLALRAELPKYDVDCWSVYSQDNQVDMVTGAYQQFIIEQLRVMYAITSDSIFNVYAEKWGKCLAQDEHFIHIAARDFLKSSPNIPK